MASIWALTLESLRRRWLELNPGDPWPGPQAAVEAMAQDIKALRLLNELLVEQLYPEGQLR
jgi:hypothetical protein